MYSSTTLEGPSKSGCWLQLTYSEECADTLFPLELRSYLGQAAHAVLQFIAERVNTTEADIRATAEEVAKLLISEGRVFRGYQEPPMPADDVYAGVDIAVAYALANPLPFEEASPLIPEQEWVHPRLPFRALIDLVPVFEEGDEDYPSRVVEVTDYKTSWQAGEDELHTLQRWGQAVCVWRFSTVGDDGNPLRNIDIIRQRIVNLRTWKEYARDIHLDDPEEVAELERWEKRIEALCERAQGPRAAVPGVGCLSCHYRHICDAEKPSPFSSEPTEMAAALAVLEGQRSLLIKCLKAVDSEMSIRIDGGAVGFKEIESRVFRRGSEKHLISDWFERMAAELPEDLAPVLTSLIAALKLGKGNLNSFAKALYPERKKGIGKLRDEYIEGVTDRSKIAQFGVWKDG